MDGVGWFDDLSGLPLPAGRGKAGMNHFDGDLERVRAASIEELLRVPGVTQRVAAAIKENL